jgi:hypothetical protein
MNISSNEVCIYVYDNYCVVANIEEDYSKQFDNYLDALTFCKQNGLYIIEVYQ